MIHWAWWFTCFHERGFSIAKCHKLPEGSFLFISYFQLYPNYISISNEIPWNPIKSFWISLNPTWILWNHTVPHPKQIPGAPLMARSAVPQQASVQLALVTCQGCVRPGKSTKHWGFTKKKTEKIMENRREPTRNRENHRKFYNSKIMGHVEEIRQNLGFTAGKCILWW